MVRLYRIGKSGQSFLAQPIREVLWTVASGYIPLPPAENCCFQIVVPRKGDGDGDRKQGGGGESVHVPGAFSWSPVAPAVLFSWALLQHTCPRRIDNR